MRVFYVVKHAENRQSGPIVEFPLPVDKFAVLLFLLCCVQLHQLYFKVS